MEYVFYIVLFLLVFNNYKNIKRSPFSPWGITIMVWSVIALIYNFQNVLNSLTDKFYICCILWLLSFVATSKLFYKFSSNIKPLQDSVNTKILLVFYGIIIITLPAFSSSYLNAVGGFSFDKLIDIRNNAVSGDVTLGLLSYVPALCKSVLLIELYLFTPKRWIFLLSAIIINIIPAIVIMEKGYLAFIFIAIVFFLYMKSYIKNKHLAIFTISFFFLMFIFNQFRSMIVGEGQIMNFAALYCVSPSVAFGTIEPNQTDVFGSHTFRFFYAILHSVGIGPEAVSNWYEPVYVPIKTNVFTVMEPYYHDFGILGVLLFGIINGAICGLLYNNFMKKRTLFISCLYAYYVYMLVFQFFQEWFFISLSPILQISIFIFITTLGTKKKF